jgi:hypothetical protein
MDTSSNYKQQHKDIVLLLLIQVTCELMTSCAYLSRNRYGTLIFRIYSLVLWVRVLHEHQKKSSSNFLHMEFNKKVEVII